jgi:hypothetical protein
MEEILMAVRRHLDSREFCLERQIPHHMGLLLAGPPGTGKTSVAKVLASEFDLNLHHLQISDVESDGDLTALVQDMGANCMLLIEDADSYHATTDRQQGQGVTLSGLLQALDGLHTPEGLLTVITTNHPERLDEALLRPGRIDKVMHLGLMDQNAFGRYWRFFYQHLTLPTQEPQLVEPVVPAVVTEAFKRHPHDWEAGVREIPLVVQQGDLLTRRTPLPAEGSDVWDDILYAEPAAAPGRKSRR